MEFLSQMDEESKERLRKKELQVHTRRKDAPQPPPSDPRFPQARPHPIPKDDNMDLSTNMVDILQRVKRIRGMLEIPSLEETRGFSNDQEMFEDPSILLQANHFEQTKEEHAPFFISLAINDLWLHNCMLDSGASINMMTLKVMTDAWGMLLSRKWAATLGGSLQMDLSYATILVGAQSHITLYNKPRRKEHVEKPDYGNDQSNYDSIDPCSSQDWGLLSLCTRR
jgi:hypothetical protein